MNISLSITFVLLILFSQQFYNVNIIITIGFLYSSLIILYFRKLRFFDLQIWYVRQTINYLC